MWQTGEVLCFCVADPEQVVVRVENITSSLSSSSLSATSVAVCWNPPRIGKVAKYELNVASTQSVDVGQRHRQQIWIAATDGLVERRNDDVMGRRYCYQLRTAILHPGGLHYVVLRPWTVVNRPGLSVGTLFRTSGGHNFSLVSRRYKMLSGHGVFPSLHWRIQKFWKGREAEDNVLVRSYLTKMHIINYTRFMWEKASC